jgi:hypothetical protein
MGFFRDLGFQGVQWSFGQHTNKKDKATQKWIGIQRRISQASTKCEEPLFDMGADSKTTKLLK